MRLLKTFVISAAVYGVYKFLTEKDDLGNTRLDDIKEKAPEWLDKVRVMKEDLKTGKFPESF